MKKIILVFAAVLASATLAFAQEYNDVADVFNKGAAAYSEKNYEEALVLLKDAYAQTANLEASEEVATMIASCKQLIPDAAYKIATKQYNAQEDWGLAIEKIEEAIAVANEFEAEEYVEKATGLLKDARYEKAKSLEDTDFDAAKAALAELMESDERAAGRIATITARKATELQKSAADIADAAEKKAVYKEAYDLAKESLSYEESANVYKTMAACARSIENWNDAILGYEKYLELKPDAKDAIKIANNIAGCYEKAGKKADALKWYKKVAAGDDEKLKASAAKKIEKLSK